MIDVTRQEILHILKRCEVFLGLSDADLEKIAALPSAHTEIFEKGAHIANEGEKSQNLYILADGKVDLRMLIELDLGIPPKEITVDTVTKGSVFAWSALVRPYILNRTFLCAETSTVLMINGKELIALMDSNEHIGYEIMQNIAFVIASRLRIPNNYFWAESLRKKAFGSLSQS
ncbi:MAG: cyclic nucleotide-binding domain-containing protein [Dehalococcoidia bacterium]